MNFNCRTATFLFALGAAAACVNAGDLNPPVGPIAPTHKTLTQVEPRITINSTNTPGDADSLFRITQPGSYYLTGNITGVAGRHAIEIATSGVTVDLMGFDLVGVAGMGNFNAVAITANVLTNITVRNGSVRNWGGAGIDLTSATTINCRVENIVASGNAGDGIRVQMSSVVTNCASYNNAGDGFELSFGCVVTNCSAYDNNGNGFVHGVTGVTFSGDGCILTDCSAEDNGLNGISVGKSSTITNCSVNDNGEEGIITVMGGTITNCSIIGNNANGINAGEATTITGCTLRFNTDDGINAADACRITGCNATENGSDGISVASYCVVRDNTCHDNGSTTTPGGGVDAGIRVLGNRNRIDGNNCSLSRYGIIVLSNFNIIVRNTCSGNTTNWEILAGNAYGPIILAPAGAAMSGDAAPSTLGTIDPNANFTR